LTATETSDVGRVKLSGSLAVEALDDTWAACESASNSHLLVDLSDCGYLEPIAMMDLIAILAKRWSDRLPFSIELPKKRSVRDIMRIWQFPVALSTALDDTPFRSVLTPHSQSYAGESRSHQFTVAQVVPIQVYKTPEYANRREMVRSVADPAESTFMNVVLRRRLSEGGVALVKKIIREAFRNAINHPNAALVQAGSSLTVRRPRAGEEDDHGTYTFFVWDNGRSIAETLRETLRSGIVFQQDAFHDLHRSFAVRKYSGRTHQISEYKLHSSETPTMRSDAGDLLLSSLFPGVANMAGPSEGEDETPRGPKGTGLFHLANHAIDVLGGTLSLRSENVFLNVKRLPDTSPTATMLPALSAKIVELPENRASVKGNLIAVRLPFGRPQIRVR